MQYPTHDQTQDLLQILKNRFNQNKKRHPNLDWETILKKIIGNQSKLKSLFEMEQTGGEPDVICFNSNEYYFIDCSSESPTGRRSLCYDIEALNSRKENKPKDNAIGVATTMGVKLLNEYQYRELQKFGPFDTKTSSWLETPTEIRNLDGAIFGDFRYNTVFIYHNGSQSYYAARGFRALLEI